MEIYDLRRWWKKVKESYEEMQRRKALYPDRWKYCPSTHCERGGECRSPSDCCSAVLKEREV
jgi:hypothetical protein